MRVGLKLTIVILGLLVSVLAVEGLLRLEHERSVFENDVQRAQSLLGRALRPSIELAWQTHGLAAAQEILWHAQQGEAEVSVRLVALKPGAEGAEPAIPITLRDNDGDTLIQREGNPGAVYTYVPVNSPTGHGTALELVESLAETDKRLRSSAIRVFWTAVVIILSAGWLAVAMGERLVGRPVRKLANKAARIARGDLSPLAKDARRDEIGELKRAIADMVNDLAVARDRVAQETEARVTAERRMRQGERLAAVGTLAAGVAHELGTPLQVVSGRADLIGNDAATSETGVRNAVIIREQAERMERIVRQLLSLARPRKIIAGSVDLVSLVHEVLDLLSPEAERRKIEVEQAILTVRQVVGERDLLLQTINNLIRNAMQAMPGGGTLRISIYVPQTIAPPGNGNLKAEDFLCLEVADEGEGIDPSRLSRIFDPFFTTKDVGEGTGLGLSVAYGIVREHGGWITAESEPGDGATFKVYLPTEANDSDDTDS